MIRPSICRLILEAQYYGGHSVSDTVKGHEDSWFIIILRLADNVSPLYS